MVWPIKLILVNESLRHAVYTCIEPAPLGTNQMQSETFLYIVATPWVPIKMIRTVKPVHIVATPTLGPCILKRVLHGDPIFSNRLNIDGDLIIQVNMH